jgi:hypothetical protein
VLGRRLAGIEPVLRSAQRLRRWHQRAPQAADILSNRHPVTTPTAQRRIFGRPPVPVLLLLIDGARLYLLLSGGELSAG